MRKALYIYSFMFLLVIILTFLVGFLCCESRENSLLKKEVRDLELRLASAEERVDTFIIRDSIPVAQVKVVEIDRTDYKKELSDRCLINDLKLRVSELESENRMLLSTRDTVFLGPVNDSIFTYSDKWSSFSYDLASGVLDWEVRDSLSTFVSVEYRHHFLWLRWKKKGYRVTIVNYNPRSRVEYSKYIKIK